MRATAIFTSFLHFSICQGVYLLSITSSGYQIAGSPFKVIVSGDDDDQLSTQTTSASRQTSSSSANVSGTSSQQRRSSRSEVTGAVSASGSAVCQDAGCQHDGQPGCIAAIPRKDGTIVLCGEGLVHSMIGQISKFYIVGFTSSMLFILYKIIFYEKLIICSNIVIFCNINFKLIYSINIFILFFITLQVLHFLHSNRSSP